MKYDFHNHIRVFCNRFDLDRGSSEVKNLRNSFEQKEKFDKQTYEWLVGFLKCKNQSDAKKFITNETKRLSERKDVTPEDRRKYEQQLKTLSMWITDKKLFPTDLLGRQNMNIDSIRELQRGLGLSDERINEVKDIDRRKAAEAWKNQPGNEIKEYTKKILNDTIAHPIAVKRGKHSKIGEKLVFLSEVSLYEEKRRIEKLGIQYLPEHYAVIMTLLRLLNDKGKAYEEFDTYTGSWRDSKKQEKAGTAYNLTEYKDALKLVLDRAVQSKTAQEPKPILGEYQQSLAKEAKEAEKELRKQINEDTIMAAFEGSSRKEIQENLGKLKTIIFGGEFWQKYSRWLGTDLLDIIRMLETAEEVAKDSILEDTLFNNVGINRKRSVYLEEVKKALIEAKEKKEVVRIAFSGGKFKRFGQDDIEQFFKNPESMNTNLWKQIVEGDFWKTDLGAFGDLWSVAAYIDERPDTRLLIVPEPRRTELQKFLSQKLTEHKVYEFKGKNNTPENTQSNVESNIKEKREGEISSSNYIQRLYERLKNIEELKKIPEVTLKNIIADGKIEGEELYKALNLGTPKQYQDFEKKFQVELDKIIVELEKEVNVAAEQLSGDIKTVEGVLAILGITNKGKVKNILTKKIKELSFNESQELYDIIKKSGKQNHTSVQSVLVILENTLFISRAVKDSAASKSRVVHIELNGEVGVPNIKNGTPKAKSIENASRDVGAATYEKTRQIRAIEGDAIALNALKKLGYKPEDLDKPIIAIEIQKKVNALPDGPEKSALLKYIPTIANITQQQVSAIGTIIRNEPTMATEYISSITGMSREQVQANMPVYEYINRHVYQSAEYNQSAFTDSIAKMNIGESKNIGDIVDGGGILGNTYSIMQTKRGVYTVHDASGKPIVEGLSEDQSEEVVEDMLLFASMGFGDLIPRLTDIKERVALKTSRDTKLNGKTSEQEQLWIMRPLYEKLFGVQSETLNIHDFDRELCTIGQTPEERKKSVRQKLKENNLMRQDNTLSSPDTIISFLKTL